MPRWRSAAIALALLALGHAPATVVAAVAQQHLAHLHGSAHHDPGPAAEHGHQHPPSVVEHAHAAVAQLRADTVAAPEPNGDLSPSTPRTRTGSPTPAIGIARGTGCDPPAVTGRNPILRI